jgi:glycosyltransferase involved in cell wall biosynthesis
MVLFRSMMKMENPISLKQCKKTATKNQENMKIVFICGSLEPGKDGVGDYTRRLAGGLIRKGIQVEIIAINDKHIQSIWQGLQTDEDASINVHRLAASIYWNTRVQTVKDIIKIFEPDWISLQFVIFSFHNKGLPFKLAANLKEIGGNRKWHIMFHELWVGMNKERTLKLYWWGRIQKYLIQYILHRLQPKVIHTQTQLYKKQLAKIGYDTLYLPLFSNIKTIQAHSEQKKHIVKKCKRIVIFGMIQEDCPIKAFAKETAAYIKEKKEDILFIFLGRSGQRLNEWKVALESESLNVKIEGEQSPEVISDILSTSDFGLSSTPLAQTEKSGTVAAMREHGLPVICIGRPWSPVGIESFGLPDRIFEYQQDNLKTIFECTSKLKRENSISNNSLSIVTNLFISSLLN